MAIIGDSLTVGVTSPSILGDETLQALLAREGRDVTLVSARNGRTIGQGIDVIRTHRREIEAADVVLLGLGTNDIWGRVGSDEASARAEIDRATNAVLEIDPGTIVVWIDLSVESVASRTRRFNAALTSLAADVTGIEKCSWRDGAVARPGTFAADGIHLTVSGYRARRDTILDCLRQGDTR